MVSGVGLLCMRFFVPIFLFCIHEFWYVCIGGELLSVPSGSKRPLKVNLCQMVAPTVPDNLPQRRMDIALLFWILRSLLTLSTT